VDDAVDDPGHGSPMDAITVGVAGSVLGIFMNQGEICSAGSHIFVSRAIYDETLELTAEYAHNVNVGMALDPKTEMGPVVSREQYDRVLRYISSGLQEGASLLAGGHSMPGAGPGYFIEPTIFTGLSDSMRIAQEEISGPVATVMPFDSLEEVTERANHSSYGLAAGVWTENVRTAHVLAENLDVGTVWINAYHIFDAAAKWVAMLWTSIPKLKTFGSTSLIREAGP
jgi:acyl-CoA reductase-like NAD-dependent aldehyde dehydrogenase